MFGVTTNARGSSSAFIAPSASSSSSRVAALGHHHRIDDDQRDLEIVDRRGHGFDDGRVGEHARLRGMGADVCHHRFESAR